MPKIRPGKQEEVEAPRPLRPAVVRVRGWAAGELLAWRWALPWLTAECSRAVYFIKAERREVLAHAELRDLDGRRRVEIGSFATVETAKAGCERHAQALYRREGTERGPVSVAIASTDKADKGRQLGRRIHWPTDPDEAQRRAAANAEYWRWVEEGD